MPLVSYDQQFHCCSNSLNEALIVGRYTILRDNKLASLSTSKIPLFSTVMNMSLYRGPTTLFTSQRNRSIRWLWTLLPVTKVPVPVPLVEIMNFAISLFSTPQSARTCDGTPNFSVPSTKNCKALEANCLCNMSNK